MKQNETRFIGKSDVHTTGSTHYSISVQHFPGIKNPQQETLVGSACCPCGTLELSCGGSFSKNLFCWEFCGRLHIRIIHLRSKIRGLHQGVSSEVVHSRHCSYISWKSVRFSTQIPWKSVRGRSHTLALFLNLVIFQTLRRSHC